MISAEAHRHHVESVDGTRIAVLVQPVAGPPTADQGGDRLAAPVPALLVHGFGSNARANWQATGWFRTLARAGIPAAALDLRGHGWSDRPHRPQAYTVGAIMADLSAVLSGLAEWFGPSAAVDLIGYSLGGRMAVELAAEAERASPAAPDHSPTVPGHSPARVVPVPRRLVVGGHDGRRLLETIDVAELTRLVRSGAARPPGESPAGRLVAVARAVPGNDPEALLAVAAGLIRDGRVTEPASPPTLPTLVVAGSADPVADRAQEWAASMPTGSVVIVPGRNHVTTVTAATFRNAAADFLTA